MPDLNELLRWSIANSTRDDQAQAQSTSEAQPTPSTQSSTSDGLTLRYNPPSAAQGHAGTAALHPSDLALADLSPASTPGPGTPVGGTLPLPVPSDKKSDLSTEMLDLILGKSDSIVMKEKMELATDESLSADDRVEALDDFEMLIELIDNANNMPILKLWQPLLGLLQSPHPEIVAHTCWIIGTAVQNNLKAQAALYINDAFPLILSTLISSPSASVRAKATYALSSALKHWPLAESVLAKSYDLPSSSSSQASTSTSSSSSSSSSASSSSGYAVLIKGIKDQDKIVRRKMSFLISTLIMQSGEKYEGEIPNEVRALLEERMKEVSASASGSTSGSAPKSTTLVDGLKREQVFGALSEALKRSSSADIEGEGDVEFEENAIRALSKALEKDGLTAGEKAEFKTLWGGLSGVAREERGLGGEDGKSIDALLA